MRERCVCGAELQSEWVSAYREAWEIWHANHRVCLTLWKLAVKAGTWKS